MERDFVQKYGQGRPELITWLREIYNEVVADLIAEIQRADGLQFEEDNEFLRRIAIGGVSYAREFTRDQSSPLFEARRSKARARLQNALESWQQDFERRAAAWEAARQLELNPPRRKRRKAAKALKK